MTATLGRSLFAASLLSNAMKEDNATITLRINGDGIAGSIITVSDCHGNVRGTCGDPAAELPHCQVVNVIDELDLSNYEL